MSSLNCIYTGEDRLRVAIRSEAAVFIPTPDPQQHVSDYTGNYWPYRSLTLDQVIESEETLTAAKRTVNRTLSLRLVDTRHPGANFPQDLYEYAEQIRADQVLPVVHTGTARDAISNHVSSFEMYDFKRPLNFVIPVAHPHELTACTLRESIYNSPNHGGITDDDPLTHACIRDISPETDYEKLEDIILTVADATSSDVQIHLRHPPLSGDLVKFIRCHPIISSVTISPEEPALLAAEEDAPEYDTDTFSATGKRDLREPLSPYVRVAAEFSFLCSPFLEDEHTQQALAESVIPTGNSPLPLTNTSSDQTTLGSQ